MNVGTKYFLHMIPQLQKTELQQAQLDLERAAGDLENLKAQTSSFKRKSRRLQMNSFPIQHRSSCRNGLEEERV